MAFIDGDSVYIIKIFDQAIEIYQKDNGTYKMWYAGRVGANWRIIYAESR